MNTYCSNCIRGCLIENSFCRRRDFNEIVDQEYLKFIFNIDRLFDKPIIYFSENIKILSIGSWGCNFRCLGCQNARLSWAESGEAFSHSLYSKRDIIEMAIKTPTRTLV